MGNKGEGGEDTAADGKYSSRMRRVNPFPLEPIPLQISFGFNSLPRAARARARALPPRTGHLRLTAAGAPGLPAFRTTPRNACVFPRPASSLSCTPPGVTLTSSASTGELRAAPAHRRPAARPASGLRQVPRPGFRLPGAGQREQRHAPYLPEGGCCRCQPRKLLGNRPPAA